VWHRGELTDAQWERVQAEADAAGDIDWDVSVDSTSVRAHQHAAGARHSPPPRAPGFDKERYAKRNTVERAINKLKQFRAVATRYDKRAYVYLGTVTAAALVIWLRS